MQLDTALELHGLIDRRHKLRGTWLQKLVTMVATARIIDALLGLERKERDITGLSAAEWAAHTDKDTARTNATRKTTEDDDEGE